MKKLIAVVVLVLFLCIPVQADIYSWVWGDSDAIGARVGTDISKDIEVGLSALWWPDREMPEIWGVYAIYHLPDILQIPNPIDVDFLPEIISGKPYVGGKLDIDFEIDKGSVSPIVGIVFNKVLFFEYQFESFDRVILGESKIVFGLRFEF